MTLYNPVLKAKTYDITNQSGHVIMQQSADSAAEALRLAKEQGARAHSAILKEWPKEKAQ